MAKGTSIQEGETIDYTNSGASAIGYKDVVPLTTRIGIAGENIAVGATGSLQVEGVWELPAITGTAFAVGDQLYWDAANNVLNKTLAGNTPAGWATEPKAAAAATARVKIHG